MIRGYEGSTAQAYAEKYGCKAEAIAGLPPAWSISDVIKLQKYLIGLRSGLSKDYDLDKNGIISVYDLILLKRKLIYV